jgi:hypothetical protein
MSTRTCDAILALIDQEIGCRFCNGSTAKAPSPLPFGVSTAAQFHNKARCVEGDEPSYKMGGPA